MLWLNRQVSPIFRFENRLHQAAPVRRLGVRVVCLAAFGSLSFATYLARSEDALTFPVDPGLSPPALANPIGGIHPQMVSDQQIVQIKIEGFNKKRERDIANDSEKLLSLAVALKAEIDESDGRDRSDDAAAKAKEIERLARHVKSQMLLSPALGPI